MAKSLQTLADEATHALLFDPPAKAAPLVDVFYAAAAKTPFGGWSGRRENLELDVLKHVMPAKRRKTGPLARRIWIQVATAWATHAPRAGHQHWYSLARAHRELGVRVPSKLVDSIRRAWANGRMFNAKGERAFAAYDKAKTPDARLDALRAIAAKAGARFEFWECICAALLLLDDPDPALAKTALARWKATEGDKAEPSLYELG